VYSAVKQLFTYRGMDIAVGERAQPMSRILMATVSNGQWLGGAFHIAPDASATDGKLDVALIADSGVVERARLFMAATRGTHVGRPSVQPVRTEKITLRFSAPPAMEIDGELRYANSETVAVECIPRALSVIAAPSALTG
jgi:diacylglycerol kinase (ATP)